MISAYMERRDIQPMMWLSTAQGVSVVFSIDWDSDLTNTATQKFPERNAHVNNVKEKENAPTKFTVAYKTCFREWNIWANIFFNKEVFDCYDNIMRIGLHYQDVFEIKRQKMYTIPR